MACWRTVAAQHAKASWESLAAQGRQSGNNTVPIIIKAEIDQDCWFTDDSNNQVGFCRVWCFGRTHFLRMGTGKLMTYMITNLL